MEGEGYSLDKNQASKVWVSSQELQSTSLVPIPSCFTSIHEVLPSPRIFLDSVPNPKIATSHIVTASFTKKIVTTYSIHSTILIHGLGRNVL